MQQQLEIQFFWPLTEQIPLDLDYGPTHLHFRAKGIAGVHSMPIGGSIYEFTTVPTDATWSSCLHIDSETITFGNLPMPWYRKVLFKLLGFKWRSK
jgi:hypothetical protein